MDDIEKERIVKRSSLELLRSFFSITGRTVAAVLVSVAPLVALEMADLAKFSSVTRLLSTWQGIVLSSFVMAVTLFVRTKN
jgi:hypothetical protein